MSIVLIGGHADGQRSRDYGKYCHAASKIDLLKYADPSPEMSEAPSIRTSAYRKEILRVETTYSHTDIEIYVVEGMELETAIRKLCYHYKP